MPMWARIVVEDFDWLLPSSDHPVASDPLVMSPARQCPTRAPRENSRPAEVLFVEIFQLCLGRGGLRALQTVDVN
jgi:hypothetical protein